MQEMAVFKPFTKYYGFDADPAECERLRRAGQGYAAHKILPYFIGKENERVIFHVYKRPAQSSRFVPDPRYQRLYGGELFAIEKDIPLESRSLDAVLSVEKLDPPDFIKLDTQGSELSILEGAKKALAGAALMVEVEVAFVPMYAGQPLLHDVAAHLHEAGFELLYLNRVFEQHRSYEGPSRGRVTFGDALFGRREDRLEHFAPARILKYILLLLHYGHRDLAHTLMSLHPETRQLLPALPEFFQAGPRKSLPRLLKAGLVSQWDKLLALGLYARKYNHLPSDSDRGWPFR
jgi:FkbM family methyltransferase